MNVALQELGASEQAFIVEADDADTLVGAVRELDGRAADEERQARALGAHQARGPIDATQRLLDAGQGGRIDQISLVQHQHIGEALRKHRLRRHHRPHQLRIAGVRLEGPPVVAEGV